MQRINFTDEYIIFFYYYTTILMENYCTNVNIFEANWRNFQIRRLTSRSLIIHEAVARCLAARESLIEVQKGIHKG